MVGCAELRGRDKADTYVILLGCGGATRPRPVQPVYMYDTAQCAQSVVRTSPSGLRVQGEPHGISMNDNHVFSSPMLFLLHCCEYIEMVLFKISFHIWISPYFSFPTR